MSLDRLPGAFKEWLASKRCTNCHRTMKMQSVFIKVPEADYLIFDLKCAYCPRWQGQFLSTKDSLIMARMPGSDRFGSYRY